MKRVAVISAILEEPSVCQQSINNVISSFKGMIKGRMGIPLHEENLAIISIVVLGELDDINNLTGKIGSIDNVTVKCSISKKEL